MKKSKRNIFLNILCVLLIFLGAVEFSSATWYITKFGDTGFSSVLFTLTSGVKGSSAGLINSFLLCALLPAIASASLLSLLLLIRVRSGEPVCLRLHGKEKKYDSVRFFDRLTAIISAVLFLVLTSFAFSEVGLPEWTRAITKKSTLYEDEYIAPSAENISFPDNKRNLIYIFLESMETSYLSKEQGGAEDICLIPELYSLALEGTNFSHNDGVGGWGFTENTTWTIASIIAQTSGVPLSLPVDGIKIGSYDSVLPGITNLSDVLRDAGYKQAYMVGSDASFGGRGEYYSAHGTDNVYDLSTAKADGLVPEDYFVWWGMEDEKLFSYAKDKISDLADGQEPFAFSMLTVDTHHIGGYVCAACGDSFSEQYENVIACSSHQVSTFVDWLKDQPFYKNTTVIICGDHRSMDAGYFSRNIDNDYDRHIYNCILNSTAAQGNTKNRSFTPMDMFPTTLAAMGCEINGDRLGLGTNLFSDTPTLAEKYGEEKLGELLSGRSSFYAENFTG